MLFVEIIHHRMRMRDPDGVQVNLTFKKYFLLECHRTRELIAVIKIIKKHQQKLMQLFVRKTVPGSRPMKTVYFT